MIAWCGVQSVPAAGLILTRTAVRCPSFPLLTLPLRLLTSMPLSVSVCRELENSLMLFQLNMLWWLRFPNLLRPAWRSEGLSWWHPSRGAGGNCHMVNVFSELFNLTPCRSAPHISFPFPVSGRRWWRKWRKLEPRLLALKRALVSSFLSAYAFVLALTSLLRHTLSHRSYLGQVHWSGVQQKPPRGQEQTLGLHPG